MLMELIFYVYGCFASMYVCALCACLVPMEALEEDVGVLGIGVTHGCESLCCCYELKNAESQQEQQTISNIEPPFQCSPSIAEYLFIYYLFLVFQDRVSL